MRKRQENNLYVLEDYFRDKIDLDTALDARHLVSILVSFCPELALEYQENCVICKNLRNHMLQRITITWKYQI